MTRGCNKNESINVQGCKFGLKVTFARFTKDVVMDMHVLNGCYRKLNIYFQCN